MTVPDLEITGDPGPVWRVGFEPDVWAWTSWIYATDDGRFDGRWDDQEAQFRTLYTGDTLAGCFLELLARFRPSSTVAAALAAIVDDDGGAQLYPEAADGSIGHRWLEGRKYGRAHQDGTYCFITHSRTLAGLQASFPFARHGVSPPDVDTALLKLSDDRKLTRSIANWVFDLQAEGGGPLVEGIEFRSRHGDDIRMWAVFERPDDGDHSAHLHPDGEQMPVTEDLSELVAAFTSFGLVWAD